MNNSGIDGVALQAELSAKDWWLPDRNEDSLDIQKFLEELSKQWKEALNTLDEADLQRSLLRKSNPT
jgi:hypothetical protein